MSTSHVSNSRNATLIIDGSGDRWIVDAGVRISDPDIAIHLTNTASNNTLEIRGLLKCDEDTVLDEGTGTKIAIAGSGRLIGDDGIFSLHGARITNAGLIDMLGNGVSFYDTGTLINSGMIKSGDNNISLADGTIDNRRGSITVDDEGTPSAYNVLIEDGRLVGYMQDRQNARLMGMKATGNGRRQGYAHQPMPRMTNTFMLSGDKTPEEIIASVKKGIYAVSFGGGQVDITSGKFVFGCTEAYLIENGKIGAPVKGAMLIGNGPDAMKRISMIGNDTKLDTGIGNCGKAGQWVPVGVGQPHLRMDQITVGGTKA